MHHTGRGGRVDHESFTALHYRDLFGWTVDERQGQLHLTFGNGMAGVLAPMPAARRIAQLLAPDRLCGPVIELTNGPPRWLFLADQNGLVPTRSDLPAIVDVLCCPSQAPLPSAATSAHARWVIPPSARRRWLPTLASVIAAVQEVLPATLARPDKDGLRGDGCRAGGPASTGERGHATPRRRSSGSHRGSMRRS